MVHAKVGSRVAAGEPLCTIHAADEASAAAAADAVLSAYTLAAEPVGWLPILLDRIVEG